MYIDKNDIALTERTYAYIYRASEEEIKETFKEEVKKYIEIISKFVNADFKKLSDEEFYDLLCEVYGISLDEEDYLKIISKRNNKEYNRFTEIGTFMTFTDIATEGKGRSFSWWNQLYQVRYIVAVSKDFNIHYDSTFSKTDIKEMIDNKSIVIVSKKTEPLNDEPSFKKEEVENFPSMNLKFSNSFDEICGYIEKGENFPIVASMLKRKFTKKRILNDMKDYIEQLQCQIEEVLDSSFDYTYDEISRLCSEWFENSEEKQKYALLQKKLNINS